MAESSRYVRAEGWTERVLAFGERRGEIADVTVDKDDRIYLLFREPGRVRVYDTSGSLLDTWPDGILSERPHGITAGTDGMIYCADEASHTVRKFRPNGEVVWTIGVSGCPSETGADWSLPDFDSRVASIKRSGGPFNGPTKVAVAPDGDLYVTDGYGNARVHHFSKDGTLIDSWGAPGTGISEFHVPHSICITQDGLLLVADRENDRIQIFTPTGTSVGIWDQVQRPADVAINDAGYIFVSELQQPRGRYSWIERRNLDMESAARVSILDTQGRVMERLALSDPASPVAGFISPHGLALDSAGSLYVAEPLGSYLAAREPADRPDADQGSHKDEKVLADRRAVHKLTWS